MMRKGLPRTNKDGSSAGYGGWHRSSYFGDPDKFNAIRKVESDIRNIRALKLPADPDSVIFCSMDTLKSQLEPINYSPFEMAFTYLGPVSRTWFRFASENIIEGKDFHLSDYRVVVVPWAQYERKSSVSKLMKFAENGGTLIVGDPKAFSCDLDGSDQSSLMESLVGAKVVFEARRESEIKLTAEGLFKGVAADRKLSAAANTCHYFVPNEKVEILGTYTHNGRPAIIAHSYGRGRVLAFGSNPFLKSACASNVGTVSQDYRRLFQVLSKNLELKGEREIWRFQFPLPAVLPKQKHDDTCLTNNNIDYENDAPVLRNNFDSGGSYTYSIAPDSRNDGPTEANQAIAFRDGRLTNRCAAVSKPNKDLAMELDEELDKVVPRLTPERRDSLRLSCESASAKKWVVYWDQPAAIDITVDLNSVYPLTKVRVFSKSTPALTVYSSVNGQDWEKRGEVAKPVDEQPEDVVELTVAFAPAMPARYVKVHFDQRNEGTRLIISELDIWGNTSSPAADRAP